MVYKCLELGCVKCIFDVLVVFVCLNDLWGYVCAYFYGCGCNCLYPSDVFLVFFWGGVWMVVVWVGSDEIYWVLGEVF